jgi:regulator of sigma E protease
MGYCVVGLMVAFGLGFVIFVHELGHFLVAKLCGVKCEKFYLGFDIGGLKLCRFRWGETEYGIGILPLGGYVKMLGQEDNPARLREEMERAKQASEEGSEPGAAANSQSAGAPSPLYDPRSFLAQSVPKRMAIISAGVIMNMIFAFLMAIVAFYIGVEQTPCVVGAVFPGEAAWKADIRAGDRILQIAGKDMGQFRDLQTAISLGDIDPEKGVPIEVERPGVKEPFSVTVKPDNSRGQFFIGVASGKTTELMENRQTWLVEKRNAVEPGTVAARTEPPFRNGDKIVRIDDVKIDTYGQIDTELARKANQKITVGVERDLDHGNGKMVQSISVDRNPMRTLGLVMKMGEITAVQAGSPAETAGILPGDLLRKHDDELITDPMTLPEKLRSKAGETVNLTIQREASKTPVVVPVRLRQPTGYFPPETILFDHPVEVASLGVTYRVLNRVDRVIEGSPAAKGGLQPEDLIVGAKLIPPTGQSSTGSENPKKELSLQFDETNRNWPALCDALQVWPEGTVVELTVSRQDKKQTIVLGPVEAADWFNPDRGFLFEPMTVAYRAHSVGEAFALGAQETFDSVAIVFRSLKAIGTARVSPRGLAGPVTIIKMALGSADQGHARLLLFLTMLSANLAVINFLPIPLLDGGLLMFLVYEAICRKPANEHVQVVLTYCGLAFIIGLMVWVLGLDFGLIPRH